MRRTHALVLTTALGLALSACSSGDTTAPADTAAPADSTAPADTATDAGGEAAGGSVTYTGTDTITWETPDASTSAGLVNLTLVCGASVEHELAIEGVEGDAALLSCAPGEQATGEVELAAGEYTVFCSIAGHRDAGMEGTLTVS